MAIKALSEYLKPREARRAGTVLPRAPRIAREIGYPTTVRQNRIKLLSMAAEFTAEQVSYPRVWSQVN